VMRYRLEDLKTWLAEQVVHPSKKQKGSHRNCGIKRCGEIRDLIRR